MEHAQDFDHIIIRDASENNLKHVNVRIPKRQITVVTGVSGSGKSSLVMDTIAAITSPRTPTGSTAWISRGIASAASPVTRRAYAHSPSAPVTKKIGSENHPLATVARAVSRADLPTSSRCI